MVEPLYILGIKNFDLAIFRNQNRSLLLVECKHSISDCRELIIDVVQNISETEKHHIDLEKLLGSSITQVEYVLCVPALKVKDVLEEV